MLSIEEVLGAHVVQMDGTGMPVLDQAHRNRKRSFDAPRVPTHNSLHVDELGGLVTKTHFWA